MSSYHLLGQSHDCHMRLSCVFVVCMQRVCSTVWCEREIGFCIGVWWAVSQEEAESLLRGEGGE